MQKLFLLRNFVLTLLITLIHGQVLADFPTDVMEKYLGTVLPPNDSGAEVKDQNYPVIFFLQGSGGNNDQARDWASWAARFGIASVTIDSAGVRGMKRLFGIDYESDLASALDVVSKNPRLDLTRFAVMGFSRGGTAALDSGKFLTQALPKPDFVFALYPGDSGKCRNSHSDPTKVFVFYGDQDDWGDYLGTRDACSRMPIWSSNASFHLLKNAHHSYDGVWTGKWQCCGNRTFTSEPNAQALETTRSIVARELQDKWKLSNSK